MGRHSGAICQTCQQRVRVVDGRFIGHRHDFPALGTSVQCVGSHRKSPQGWSLTGLDDSPGDSVEALRAALIEDAHAYRLDRPRLDAYLTAIQRTVGLDDASHG